MTRITHPIFKGMVIKEICKEVQEEFCSLCETPNTPYTGHLSDDLSGANMKGSANSNRNVGLLHPQYGTPQGWE